MHQTCKGKQSYHRCAEAKGYGVDSESVLIHSVETTAAHVHGLTPAADLLHGEVTVVYVDAGYQELRSEKRCKAAGSTSALPCDQGRFEYCLTCRRADWMIWLKPP